MATKFECIYCGKSNQVDEENYVGIKRCKHCGKRQQVYISDAKVRGVIYDVAQFTEDWLEKATKLVE